MREPLCRVDQEHLASAYRQGARTVRAQLEFLEEAKAALFEAKQGGMLPPDAVRECEVQLTQLLRYSRTLLAHVEQTRIFQPRQAKA